MLRARDIEPVGVDPDAVAAVRGRDRVETVSAERLAQLGDIDVDRFFGRGRRRLAPEVVDQALARDELVRMQEQDRQDEPLLQPAQRDRLALVDHLERPEDPVLHEHVLPLLKPERKSRSPCGYRNGAGVLPGPATVAAWTSTTRGGSEMNKTVATTALAAVLALAALAAVVGSARPTYPGATNGRLAFGINIGGNTDVYSVRPDGQGLRRLTTDPGFDACAAYSADGRRIAYCSGEGGGPVQVWTMKQNGTDKQQVTHMSGLAIFPDFSPDGTKLVFSAQPADSTTRDIYVIGSDGSGLTQLTSSSIDNAYPAFSPDGTKIAF